MAKDSEALANTIDYEVAYRDVKYPRLEYKTGSLFLVLPKGYRDETVLLEKHREWITEKERVIEKALEQAEEKNLNLQRTKQELRQLVSTTIGNYIEQYDFQVDKIFCKKMRTKWGSFSCNNNLTVNTMLKYLPKELIRYVIFHELVHSLERKHNEGFWRVISREFPTHRNLEGALLAYWFLIQNMY